MKLVIKIVTFILGIVGIGAVVALGIATIKNSSTLLVALFGIGSAIVAPVALSLIGYTFSSKDKGVLQELSKVPEIERLISQAKSQEEKLRLLQQQQSRLAEIVRLEARKQTLASRRSDLEEQAIRILRELEAIEQEGANLQLDLDASTVTNEIEELRERIQARLRGDLIINIGGYSFVLDKNLIGTLPMGSVTQNILSLFESLFESLNRTNRSRTK